MFLRGPRVATVRGDPHDRDPHDHRGSHDPLPRGLNAASHPRGGPARHMSARHRACSPREHLQVSNSFFAILVKKI